MNYSFSINLAIFYKITEIVRVIWLVKNLWFIIPVNPKKKAPGTQAINKTVYWSANNDFRKNKKQNKLLTQPFLILKSVGFHADFIMYRALQFTTAIALKVIKYKAGKQFTFHDDAKSQRKTTTVWISGVEIFWSRKT